MTDQKRASSGGEQKDGVSIHILIIGESLIQDLPGVFQHYNIIEVASGQVAMETLADQAIALLVIASNLTDPTPPELCRAVLEQDPNQSVIIVKVGDDHGASASPAACLNAGVIDHFSLSIPHSEFKARIESGLRRSAQYMALINKDRARNLELEKRYVQLEQASETLQEQFRELDMLDGIVGTVNRETNLKQVLECLLKEGLKLLPRARNGVFLLYDQVRHTFVFDMVIGYDMEKVKALQLPPGELYARLTAKQDELVDGIFHGRGYRGRLPTKSKIPSPRATLAMEIGHGDHLKGYLIWDHPTDERAFDHSDVRKLVRFRQHANSAVARA